MNRRIVVVVHPHRKSARAAAQTVCESLIDRGITPVIAQREYTSLSSYGDLDLSGIEVLSDFAELDSETGLELVMVLGGDGTILRAASHFHGTGVPIMGINLGHVGFLAEAERKDLHDTVEAAIARDYVVEQRMSLDITVTLGDEVIHEDWALNEATVEKDRGASMIEVVVGVDSRPVSSFGCDGVIMGTPTGSTAYAFSAGGPIIWPDVEALLMVPISAHALFSTPLVVSPSSTLGVEFQPVTPGTRAVLFCDGRFRFDLPEGARVEARRSAVPVPLARLNKGVFTDRLVAKFQLPVAGWRGPGARDD